MRWEEGRLTSLVGSDILSIGFRALGFHGQVRLLIVGGAGVTYIAELRQHTPLELSFRAESFYNKGGTHNENDGFFSMGASVQSAFALSASPRKRVWKLVRGWVV